MEETRIFNEQRKQKKAEYEERNFNKTTFIKDIQPEPTMEEIEDFVLELGM
jgi:hypothetical protein